MSRAFASARRWAVFVRERYEPATHLIMSAAFAMGNTGVAVASGTGTPVASPIWRTLLSTCVVALFFLRLRIFDEIKDYETDLKANPHRPLARGLISCAEARRAGWMVAAFEAVLVLALGWEVALAWFVAFTYSLAMLGEFGVGSWLRPRMELYAVSHTLVASLLGLTVACAATGRPLWELPRAAWLFAPANWALFNVFEFSRKSFAPAEESADTESYSSRWGPDGAAAITLAWSIVALAVTGASVSGLRNGTDPNVIALIFGSVALLVAVPYVTLRRAPAARLYRVVMSSWATALYLAIGLNGLGALS